MEKSVLLLLIGILCFFSLMLSVNAAYFGDTNGILYKVDNNGNHIWNVTIDSTIDLYDIAVDSSENVYAIGDDNGFPTNFYLFKYDSAGNYVWNVSFSGSNNNRIRGLDVDSNGNAFIGVSDNVAANILKYNSSADLQWNTTFEGYRTQSISLDSRGNLYVGTEFGSGGDLIKLNQLGGYVWNTTFNNGGAQQKVFNVDFDSSSNIYVAYAAYFGGTRLANLFQLNGLGITQWNASFGDPIGAGVDSTPAPYVAVDFNNNIYFTFNDVGPTGTVTKYDSSGTQLSNTTFSNTNLYQFDADTSEVGGAGNTSGIVFAFGMDSSLNQLWNYTASDTSGVFYSAAFDPDVSGPSMVSASSNINSGNSGDKFELNYTGSDLSGIDSVWVVLQKNDEDNNLTITLSGNGSDYNATWDSTGYENGNYLIDVFANDTLGNQKKSDNYFILTLVLSGTTVTSYVNSSLNLTANTASSFDDSANTGLALDLYVTQEINDTSVSFAAYNQNVEGTITGFASTALGKYFSITVSNDTNGNLSNADSQIRLYYTDAEVAAAGVDESTLKLYRYNTTIGEWSALDNTGVDTTNNYIWGNVTEFSNFGAGGSIPSVTSTIAAIISSAGGGGGSSGITVVGYGEVVNVEILKDVALKARMNQGSTMAFVYNGEEHTINLKEINNELNSLTLEIQSFPQLVEIHIGETKDVDLDNDGVFDIRINLKNLISTKADLEITGLSSKSLIQNNEQEVVSNEIADSGLQYNQEPLKSKSSLWLIFGIIFVMILISIAIYISYKRNKHQEIIYPPLIEVK